MDRSFHRPTAERLARLFEEVRDFRGLAEVLEKDVRASNLKAEDLPQKLLRLGEIYRDRLESNEDAIRVFTALLKLDGRSEHALVSLQTLLEKERQWTSLMGVLKKRLENLLEPAGREAGEAERAGRTRLQFEMLCKIGEVYRNELHAGHQAIIYYEKALELEPESLPVIHTLQDLYAQWGCTSGNSPW
jgi:tetratricopeptide (TPR) repeat protein